MAANKRWLGLTAADRFWSKVDKNGPEHPTLGRCWIWTGYRNKDGRGRFWWKDKVRYAYRVSLELDGQTVPPDMDADHLCRVKECVNPAHLRIVDELTSSMENNDTPFILNAAKTHCKRGHPFDGENLARYLTRNPRDTKWRPARGCLTCYPSLAVHGRRFWLPGDVLPGESQPESGKQVS
jgi:hypothetical protein